MVDMLDVNTKEICDRLVKGCAELQGVLANVTGDDLLLDHENPLDAGALINESQVSDHPGTFVVKIEVRCLAGDDLGKAVEALISCSVDCLAKDIQELWLRGDVDGEDSLLKLRDGALKGNTKPILFHSYAISEFDVHQRAESKLTAAVVLS